MVDFWEKAVLVEAPATEPEPEGCQHGCHGGKPEQNLWRLSVNEGQASVACATCGCLFDGLADGNEGLEMDPIPVRLEYMSNCTGSHYFEGGICDCGYWFQATPTSG